MQGGLYGEYKTKATLLFPILFLKVGEVRMHYRMVLRTNARC
jgi:hypothetical protein